jgi:hypothetical protein
MEAADADCWRTFERNPSQKTPEIIKHCALARAETAPTGFALLRPIRKSSTS